MKVARSLANTWSNPVVGAVLIAGGGMGSLQAALTLADSGFFVYLLEESSGLGQNMLPSAVDLSVTSPMLVEKINQCRHHLNIRCMVLCSVLEIEGSAGNFTVSVRELPRYVAPSLCIGCGLCADRCPQERFATAINLNRQQKAIFAEEPAGFPIRYLIDSQACRGLSVDNGPCSMCLDTCPVQAISFTDTEKIHRLPVGAVLLDAGIRASDPHRLENWQYGKQDIVVTSWEFEEYLGVSDMLKKRLFGAFDQRLVKKIAFVQCVGSRDEQYADFSSCSASCCDRSIRQALRAKSLADEIEATVFYMDIRHVQFEGDLLYEQAKQAGVRFIRCRPGGLETGGQAPSIRYFSDQGKQIEKNFDMIVLAVGCDVPSSVYHLAKVANIHLKEKKCAVNSDFNPVHSSRDGIFICGAFSGPKDIPHLLQEGAAAAAAAAGYLASARHSLTAVDFYPPLRDLTQEEIRVGVFFCHCNEKISAVFDLAKSAAAVGKLTHVKHTDSFGLACTPESRDGLVRKIHSKRLNRIVVVACSPQTHLPLFQETLKGIGLHPSLVEIVDIRQRCSEKISEELADIHTLREEVREAVGRLAERFPQAKRMDLVHKEALIVGGGVTGMTAARNLASQGFCVHLVEKKDVLGGHARFLQNTWSGEYVPNQLENLIVEVVHHPLITLHLSTDIVRHEGEAGNMATHLRKAHGQTEVLHHGAMIVATGARQHFPDGYAYGQEPRVVLAREFDALCEYHERHVREAKSFVFIQCAGSRQEGMQYCSRVCCTHSVQAAITLKKEDPKRQVFILFRDMQTYGWRESLYRRARKSGVHFVRFVDIEKPCVRRQGDRLEVEVFDTAIGRKLLIATDFVVLANGIAPQSDARVLAALLGIKMNGHGFFVKNSCDMALNKNVSMQIAGLACSPKPLEESVIEGLAAASQAALLLSQEKLDERFLR